MSVWVHTWRVVGEEADIDGAGAGEGVRERGVWGAGAGGGVTVQAVKNATQPRVAMLLVAQLVPRPFMGASVTPDQPQVMPVAWMGQ